jgi:hypothetical protein
VSIQLDDSAFVDNDGFRTSVMSLEPESGHNSNLGDFAGGWHVILPTSKEDHLKLFEVIAPHAICVVLMKLLKVIGCSFVYTGTASIGELIVLKCFHKQISDAYVVCRLHKLHYCLYNVNCVNCIIAYIMSIARTELLPI